MLQVLSLICATVLLASSSALKWGDYCPNRNRCKNPKRHLVCLYHNDKKPIHRYCTSLKPARVRSFSKRDQTTTLDIINGFRANLAQGLIKVTNGRLKRAYGMIRLVRIGCNDNST
nr:uncharacterized protein LOC126055207 [Helicoverpa armigera]